MSTKSVTVIAPKNLTLQQSQAVLASVLAKAGHPTCISGVKISFQDIVDPPEMVLNVDKGGQVSEAQR